MILRLILFILLFASWHVNVSAQQQKVLESLSQYTIIKSLPTNTLKSNAITLDLKDYGVWEVNLYENPIISQDIKIFGAKTGSDLKVDVSSIETYHGYVKNYPSDRVSMSIGHNFIQGQIITSHEIVYIEPAKNYLKSAGSDDVIVYSSKDVNPSSTEHMCANSEHQNIDIPKTRHTKSFDGNCLEVEIGLAADYSMVEKYGSNQDVYEQMIAVLNDTELLYDNEFEDGFNFTLGQIAISECSTCDPWIEDNDAQRLLQSFTIWASSNFKDLDQSSLWTDRDLNNNSNVGLAWIGGICQRFSCAVLEDSPNGAIKRVLMAHEMGHNFGAEHDDSGSSAIMAPTLSDTDFWSEKSINDIQTTYKRASCFSSCEESLVAKIDFEVKNNCETFEVQFEDVSLGSTHTVKWLFDGANTSSSSLSNPEVAYSQNGEYEVSLIVSSTSGLSDTTSIIIDVEIFGSPAVYFDYEVDEGVVQFTNASLDASDYYWDFGDGKNSTEKDPRHSYITEGDYQVTLYAQNECGTANYSKIVRVTFEEYEEDEETQDTLVSAIRELNLSVSSICVGGKINLNGNANGLTVEKWVIDGPVFYESEVTQFDYIFETPGTYTISLYVIEDATQKKVIYRNSIDIIGQAVAIFEVEINAFEIMISNQSKFGQSYLWDFGDGNQSREIHPSHTYAAAGEYDVKLTIIGDCGFEVETKRIVIREKPVENDYSVGFAASVYESACVGEQVILKSNNTIENHTAQWSINGSLVQNYAEDSLVVQLSAAGVWSVSLCYVNGQSKYCDDNAYRLNVKKETDAKLSVDYFGSYIRLNNQSTDETTLTWNIGNQIVSSIENPIFLVSPGTYHSTLTAQNECSVDSINFIVFSDYNKPNFVATIQENCDYTEIDFIPNPTMESIRWTLIGQNHRINTSRNDIRLRPNESYQILADYYVSGIRYRYTIPYTIKTPGLPNSVIKTSDLKKDTILLEAIGDATSYEWFINDEKLSTDQSFEFPFQEDISAYRIKLVYGNDCGRDSTETVYVKPATVTLRDNQSTVGTIKQIDLKSYPNPFTDAFELDIISSTKGKAILEILDLSGQELENMSIDLEKNHNIFQIDAQNWSPGTFILRVKSDGFVQMKRLIKIK